MTVGPFLSHAQGGSSRLRTAYALFNMTMHVGGALVRMSASPAPKGEEHLGFSKRAAFALPLSQRDMSCICLYVKPNPLPLGEKHKATPVRIAGV